jgi:hypothetical protein
VKEREQELEDEGESRPKRNMCEENITKNGR